MTVDGQHRLVTLQYTLPYPRARASQPASQHADTDSIRSPSRDPSEHDVCTPLLPSCNG